MDTEQALGMSLDDIINNQKKQKPLGSNKSKAKPGQFAKNKQSPKVFTGTQGSQRNGQAGKRTQQQKNKQGSNNGQQRAPLIHLARRPTQNGGISKPARKGPQAQINKGKQRAASSNVPGLQAPKRTGSMNEPLKITISNDRSQRPVLPRPQARPVIPNPQQFMAPGQGQASRVRSTVQAANGYTPAVRQTEYAVAAQPVRQTYQDNAGRNLNNAASYLRDPYRGDDFERGSIGGMRSDAGFGRNTQRVRVYDSLLDDSLREDDRPRTSSYSNGRQGRQSGRNNRDAYRQ